jgi:site-specific DNA-adenine methylase
MSSSFYIPYWGNKRNEIKEIKQYYNLDDYTTICEPFGGSLAFSFEAYKHDKSKKLIFGDTDKELTTFCNEFHKNKDTIVQNVKDRTELYKEDKIGYHEYLKTPTNNLEEFMTKYLFYNKIYNIRKGIFPSDKYERKPCKFVKYEKMTELYDEFFKAHEYRCIDAIEVLETIKDDEKTLVFLDPPYVLTDCTEYSENRIEHIWNYIIDFTKTCKCKYIMILDKNVFMKEIFKDNIIGEYHKRYDVKNKSTKHIIISNLVGKQNCTLNDEVLNLPST